MIRIYDTLNKKYLKTQYANEEIFIAEAYFKQKEKHLLLNSLSNKEPVLELPEIYGLILIDDDISTI